jgi:REP element-mobilizing transposase RayT
MTRARREIVDLDSTPYYHCINRCVRRAFLCGKDRHTGQTYDHRKQWIVDRIQELSSIFAIDICAYAVMSNHYHLVVRIDRERADAWSLDEVIERWYRLFNGHMLVDRYRAGATRSDAEYKAVRELAETWRARLYDLGWYMRCLNESIARQANGEDDCAGRFWEGRYKSQALLDEAALLTCMAYVDLNPIRAGLAKTPEESEFTSIYERIRAIRASAAHNPTAVQATPVRLVSFAGAKTRTHTDGVPFALADYLELVDWTGRAVRHDKKGAIPGPLPPILARLGIAPEEWQRRILYHGRRHRRVIGALRRVQAFAERLGQHWMWGAGHKPPGCRSRA